MADEEHLQKDKLFGEICNKKNWKDEIVLEKFWK